MDKKTVQNLYLAKTKIVGYKSIYNLEVNFKKGLNILIGKNGVGKSNLLEILSDALKPRGLSEGTSLKSMSIEMYSKAGEDRFEVLYDRNNITTKELDFVNSQKFVIDRAYFINDKEFTRTMRDTNNQFPYRNTVNYNFLLRSHGLHFPRCIFITYHNSDNLEYIKSAGNLLLNFEFYELQYKPTISFLDTFFFFLENEIGVDIEMGKINLEDINFDYFKSKFIVNQDVIDALRKYTPIQNIRFNPNINLYHDGENLIIDNVKIDFFVNDDWLPWSHLSDGTKRLFYIVSQIVDIGEGTILLEEPELGIHPHQFHLLMQFLLEKSATNQIIMSTHAPVALDSLDLEELDRVYLVTYDKQKGTSVRNMSDEEINKAKDYVENVGYFSDYWLHSDLEE